MRDLVDRSWSGVVKRVAQDFRYPPIDPEYPGFFGSPKQKDDHSDVEEANNNMAHVWSNRGKRSRFTDGSYPVLYTAPTKTTCYKEVGFHFENYYRPAKKNGTELNVPYIVYSLKLMGRCRDFSVCDKDYAKLCETSHSGYERCKNIAVDAISSGVKMLRTPSSRDFPRLSMPVFCKEAVKDLKSCDRINLGIDDVENEVIIQTLKLKRRYFIVKKY